MIKYTPAEELTLSLFRTPFDNALSPDNRWVRMAAVVPWDDMAKVFFKHMSHRHGRGSIDLRIVLGALLVKHVEGISDEDTIEYIQENIYAQYFVGLSSFQTEPVFVPSLFVEIRKRLGPSGAAQLNDLLLRQAHRLKAIKHRAKPGSGSGPRQDPPAEPLKDDQEQVEPETRASTHEPPNRGTLKLDATVAPQHIGYPTDTRLLHEARQDCEQLIDELYYGVELWDKKPRTYRREARKKYLAFAKRKKPGKKAIRRARKEQLNYLRRDLNHVDKMLDELQAAGLDCPWRHCHWQRFWVLKEVYRQQALMLADGRRRVDDRIVNIAQPYVRPIKRGKSGKATEFGAKLNMSETEGFCRADRIDFDNFNEGIGLQDQVEAYRELYGYYPEAVLVDQAYLNRANRKWLKDKGINHYGVPLGRKPQMSRHEKAKRRKKQNKRSHVEGKFGQAKSKYGMDDIKMKREDTSYVGIHLILLALNAKKLAEEAFFSIFRAGRGAWRGLVRRLSAFKFAAPAFTGVSLALRARGHVNFTVGATTF